MPRPEQPPSSRPLPPWLKKRLPAGPEVESVRKLLANLGLTTVCAGAHCPNLPECFARRTATFMILGDRCTRDCRFCAVPGGDVPPVRPDEPEAVAEGCETLGLRHVVITSVTRDDLPDGGAGHFARTVRAVRNRLPGAVIEVLTPDFQGSRDAIDTVLAARPRIFNHNLETVPRLYREVRPQADYRRSLGVLDYAKRASQKAGLELHTKSGLMVGLGERPGEVEAVFADLRGVDCEMLTVGQYLRPSARHLPVQEYVEPQQFAVWEQRAKAMGFLAVAAGPFVRSSYQAEHVFAGRDGAAGESGQ